MHTKEKIIKSYKYRIYPNKTQKIKISKHFGCARFVWNYHVNCFINHKDNIKDYSIKKLREIYPWLKDVSAASMQQVERDFIEFKKQFFNKDRKRKLCKPKFKTKKTSKLSFRLPNQKFKILNDKIKIEKLGMVKFIEDKKIQASAKILFATISMNNISQYYISITVEEVRPENLLKSGKIVGLDLGLKYLFVLSNGEKAKSQHSFLENQKKLKRLQQHFSRKKRK